MSPHPAGIRAAVALLISAVLSTTPMVAQTSQSAGGRGTYGVLAGVNFAKVGGSDVEDAKTRTGFVGGVYAAWPLGTGVSFQLEGLYSMEGAKINTGGNGALKLDYIRIPALLRVAIPTASTTRPFLALGPSFGFQTKCEISGSSGTTSVSASCDEFNRIAGGGFEHKTFDVAGRLEAGLTFDTNARRFIVGGSYSHGFTDVFKDTDAKNRVFSIFLGIGL
jgi:outer membrane immunogenic protein